MYKKIAIFGFFVLFLVSVVRADILINEIMADPIADENLNEWVELYNGGSSGVNLSGWIIGDSNDNDTIEGGLYFGSGTILGAGAYALITDDSTRTYDNFDCANNVLRLYVDDSSIGNGLSNSGDTLYLYDSEGSLIDSFSYNETDEGNSWFLLNDSWDKGNVTCGYSNDGSYEAEKTGCDFSVSVITNQSFFDDGNNFDFDIYIKRKHGNKSNVTLFKEIRSSSGELVKSYANLTNEITNHKTYGYSPNLDEGSYVINTVIFPGCNDTDSSNDMDSKVIIVKEEEKSNESYLKIEKIYDLGTDNKAKFGQTLRVNVIVYKGVSTKNSIALWVENDKGDRISKESKTNVYTDFTDYTLTIPVQLKPNCDYDYKDGNYTLFIEGLDREDSFDLMVEDITDEMCEEVYLSEEDKANKRKFDYSLLFLPEKVRVGEKFESRVEMMNNDDSGVKVEFWSYVYRGSKVYSGDREENKKEDFIREGDSLVVKLSNKIESADPGLYKFKVKIRKDNQKTLKEITRDIIVEAEQGISCKIEDVGVNFSEGQLRLYPRIKNYGKEIRGLDVFVDTFFESKNLDVDLKEDEEKQLSFNFDAASERNVFFIRLENNGVLDFEKKEISVDETGFVDVGENEYLDGDFFEKNSLRKDVSGMTGRIVLATGDGPRVIYQSTSYKAKELVLGGIVFLLVILLIYLVHRKDI